MRALIVSPRIPPAMGEGYFGGDKRLRIFIEAIASLCEEMDFLYIVPQAFVSDGDHASVQSSGSWGVPGTSTFAPTSRRSETFFSHYVAGMVNARHRVDYHPYSGVLQRKAFATALARKPDLVFTDQLQSMMALPSKMPIPSILFDLCDLAHVNSWRTIANAPLRPGSIMYSLQIPALVLAEIRAIRRAACTTLVTGPDARLLQRYAGHKHVTAIPNGIIAPANPPLPATEPNLLYLGKYAYEPNRLAAERLINRIWPIVHAARPASRLLIAGGETERLPSAASPPPGVDIVGFAPSLDALYARTQVVCCAMDVASGTRLKLIEAAAYARPIVSTHVGNEGLAFRDGHEALLRDDDDSFAAACIALLDDEALRLSLGSAARLMMIERYEATRIRAEIVQIVRTLIPERRNLRGTHHPRPAC